VNRLFAIVVCPVAVACGGPENQPPVAQDGTLSLDEDAGPTAGTLHGSDPDGTAVTFAVDAAEHGTVVLGGAATGGYTYDPDPDFAGSDAFTFTVTSGGLTSDPTTVSITVAPVDDAPQPVEDTADAVSGIATDIDVLVNDTDVEGDPLALTAVGQPASGTTSFEANGIVTYTSDGGFVGTDSFSYTVSDGTLSTDGTVTVTVADICASPIFRFEGTVAAGLGLALWNSSGGAKPAATGHDLGAVDSELAGTDAEYYLATRDVVDGSATAGAAVTTLGPMPQTASALAGGGYTADQITLRLERASLDADVQNANWIVYDTVETRFYRGPTGSPAHLLLELDGEPLLSSTEVFRVRIDHGDPTDTADDVYDGGVEYLRFDDASGSSSPAVQAVATAFLADMDQLEGNIGTLQVDALEVATEGDFGAEGRSGLHLDMLGGTLFPFCE